MISVSKPQAGFSSGMSSRRENRSDYLARARPSGFGVRTGPGIWRGRLGNRALASAMMSASSENRWAPARAPIGGAGQLGASGGPASGTRTRLVTIANGATARNRWSQRTILTFTGTTGTLKLEDAPSFTGSISGLAGADSVNTADISPVTIANGAVVEIDLFERAIRGFCRNDGNA